ncbi:MAG: response regulator [Gallionella sp.]
MTNKKSLPTGMTVMIRGKKASTENEYIQFDKLSALIIDDISAMRHAVRSQLQSLGMNSLKSASNAEEALRMLEVNSFDLIMCDYNLNQSSSGQHFLEHVRNEKILSARTVFVMLTAEAEYAFVANAVEFMPDDYLLKPCTEKRLRTRLERLFDRRTYLMPVLKKMDDQRYEGAVSECNKLLATAPDERRVLDLLRRKTEAQLAQNDYSGALETYANAASRRADVPWILMGMARAHYAQGDLTQAAKMARVLIDSNKNYVAAYELLAQIKQDSNDDEGAFELLDMSVRILPSAKRFRTVSEAAFLLGKLDEAKAGAEEAIRLSSGSMVEKSDDYLSLAQTQVDMGEHQAAIKTLEKNARKHGDVGMFGVTKDAILAQAYFDSGDMVKAKKLINRSTSLLANRTDSSAMTALGKAALKTGDMIFGLKLLTQAIQSGGESNKQIARHVKKSMVDTGHTDKVEAVLDSGRKHILTLIEEATKLMRSAHFVEAHDCILNALKIHSGNIEALMTAAQLHLLWLKQAGLDDKVVARAKGYLSELDKLAPNNQKVMNFYKFFNELVN